MVVYWAIAVRSFRRYATYRLAAASGTFTNTVFGFIFCGVFITLWQARPGLGGYDVSAAVTFVWIQQAMLMPLGLMGGSSTEELGERVRSGAVAVDLYRPVDLMAWWLSVDLGRAMLQLIFRGVIPLGAGGLVFDLRFPSSPVQWLAVAAAVLLAMLVSFGIRYLVALSGFWLLDSRGVANLAAVLSLFFSGTILPLVVFPGWLGEVARATPWAATLQVTADVWLGRHPGGPAAALAFQAAWAVVLLVAGQLVTRLATRKVVIQGG